MVISYGKAESLWRLLKKKLQFCQSNLLKNVVKITKIIQIKEHELQCDYFKKKLNYNTVNQSAFVCEQHSQSTVWESPFVGNFSWFNLAVYDLVS